MDQLTLVFIDGHEEHYRLSSGQVHDSSLNMLHFKQLIENNMLKLIVNHEQIQLIPLSQLRKIILNPIDIMNQKDTNVTGFLHVTVEQEEIL